MFQIVRYSPIHCQITDALVGTRARTLPMTYRFEALARKLAGRMERSAYENCSDDTFGVINAGASAFPRRYGISGPSTASAADTLPF